MVSCPEAVHPDSDLTAIACCVADRLDPPTGPSGPWFQLPVSVWCLDEFPDCFCWWV